MASRQQRMQHLTHQYRTLASKTTLSISQLCQHRKLSITQLYDSGATPGVTSLAHNCTKHLRKLRNIFAKHFFRFSGLFLCTQCHTMAQCFLWGGPLSHTLLFSRPVQGVLPSILFASCFSGLVTQANLAWFAIRP